MLYPDKGRERRDVNYYVISLIADGGIFESEKSKGPEAGLTALRGCETYRFGNAGEWRDESGSSEEAPQ